MIKKLFEYVKNKYGCEPEYLWAKFPDYAIFRHNDNRKWFGLVGTVTADKLGMKSPEPVEILNIKTGDPLLADLLVRQEGYFRGWHMNHTNWISVLLDGTVPFEDICRLLDESYAATASKTKKKAIRPPKEWIIPANPKYYDIERAFDGTDEIDWKQGAGIKAGDTVFMYVGAPVSAVLYRCRVTKTDIPFEYSDENLTISSLMRIKLERRYEPDLFPFERLKAEFGVFAIRGPRGVPNALSHELGAK